MKRAILAGCLLVAGAAAVAPLAVQAARGDDDRVIVRNGRVIVLRDDWRLRDRLRIRDRAERREMRHWGRWDGRGLERLRSLNRLDERITRRLEQKMERLHRRNADRWERMNERRMERLSRLNRLNRDRWDRGWREHRWHWRERYL